MLLWVFLAMSILNAISAVSWLPEHLPNPSLQPKECGQKSPSRVCDPEGYLGDAAGVHAALNVLETDYEYAECGNYEMGIVVVGQILGGGTDEATQEFAKAVLDKWGVGKPACNNGILLVLAVQDRKMFIATGKGAREHLPDSELEAVVDRMKPLLKDSKYPDAVEQCISDIARILNGESFAPSQLAGLWWIGIFFAFVMGSKWLEKRNDSRYQTCKRKLSQIEHERAQAKASQYKADSCAICLELFTDTNQEQELLACGHVFHKKCIESWESSRGTCPICRCPTSDASSVGRPSTRTQRLASTYDNEYAFRLSRARHQYPDFVSDEMVARWSSPFHSGQLVSDTAFIRQSPAYKAANSSSGGHSTGSSGSSFSGGSSSGGGGAGGSW